MAMERLMDGENLLEQYANVEVFTACMAHLSEQFQWPTPEEIAAITGISIDHVLEVEERLGGTYEFALPAGLVEATE